jgi:hypothetical protein
MYTIFKWTFFHVAEELTQLIFFWHKKLSLFEVRTVKSRRPE